MTDLGLQSPPPLCISESTSDQQHVWKKWIQTLECYFTAACVSSTKRRRALLIYIGGDKLRRIHDTLEDYGENYDVTKELFERYFDSKVNLTFERNKFRSLVPEPGESALSYITRLKEQAIKCNFDEYSTDSAVCDQYTEKCRDGKVRRKLLADPKLNLERLLNLSSTTELVEKYAASIENNHVEEVNQLMQNNSFTTNSRTNTSSTPRFNRSNEFTQPMQRPNTSSNQNQNYSSRSNQSNNYRPSRKYEPASQNNETPNRVPFCYSCGSKNHLAKSPNCPAVSKPCTYCHKMGHFEKMCNSKRRDQFQTMNNLSNTPPQEDDDDDPW